jgi:hypothetical protein
MSDLIHDFAHVPLANETRPALEALTLHELNVLSRQLEENEEATEAQYPALSWDFLRLCLYNHRHGRHSQELLTPTCSARRPLRMTRKVDRVHGEAMNWVLSGVSSIA